MQKYPLGEKNLYVSEFALGTMNFATKTKSETAAAILQEFIEKGGNFIDTANNYAFWHNQSRGGESESFLGEWMKNNQNRHQLVIATKVGARPLIAGGGFEKAEGLSPRALEAAVDSSLRRLQTDYIDLLYVHIDDLKTPLKDTLEILNKLIEKGKIREIGCSNYHHLRLEQALIISQQEKFHPYACLQGRYSYFQPEKNVDFGVQQPIRQAEIALCQKHNLQIIAYSPLLHGVYNREQLLPKHYQNEDNQQRQKILNRLSSEMNLTPGQLVLCWLMQKNPLVLPVIGVSDLSQLSENLAAASIALSPAVLEKMDTASYSSWNLHRVVK